MPRRLDLFTTVRTEGGLLPSDLLARIAENDSTLGGLKPADYHLNPGERLGEMVNRSWNRAMGAWAAFREALGKVPPDDPATTITRERWLLILFSEFGFGRLQTARAVEIDGRTYAVSHEWGQVPIHLVGARIDLDRRTGRVAGAARGSPHSLVQELLNASRERVWGLVTNGLRLRLLRDNVALTRQAYVEFDLEAMMEGQVYPDFVLLWLLVHQSRFEGASPSDSWLERWAKEAQAQGTRALDHLRDAVEQAIVSLGQGFLRHTANQELRNRLRSGALSKQDYYRLLLRLVYRLLFLFVAEDRGLLLIPDPSPRSRELYSQYYSVGRLRRLAERRRGTQHADLYESLKQIMLVLNEKGEPLLALPALGSFLWSPAAIGALGLASISNRDLLQAISALVVTTQDKVRRAIDYKNLGAEELGSVYESLLELHPEVNLDAGAFSLTAAAGSERKTTGSYYTPTSLITSLLDSALEPVVEQALKQPDPQASILNLKVIDPACGSGHFLIAAAHRLAKHLATVRTGEDEPPPDATRSALRDVVARCIYAVDMNEMAVELCKVSLWIETLEPGKPLSFLDHHIVCGNSLLGTTPALIAGGIPDEAFTPVEGDDKALATSLRKRNAGERAGQHWLELEFRDKLMLKPLSERMVRLDEMAGNSLIEIREKERRYSELLSSPELLNAKLAADAWCGAFMSVKRPEVPGITQSVLEMCAGGVDGLKPDVTALINQLAIDFQFHHWHLAFPDVFSVESDDSSEDGWAGGFDIVLGNAPWDRVQFEEKEWFEVRAPGIAKSVGVARKRLIRDLKTSDPPLWRIYQVETRRADAMAHFIRNSGRYPLCGKGRLNTYGLFAELDRTIAAPTGRIGVITPTGIATDDTTKEFFADVVMSGSLVSLYDFENRMALFPAIDSRMRFCLLTLTGHGNHSEVPAEFAFFTHSVDQLEDPDRRFRMSAKDLALFNPNTKTSPIFRFRQDLETMRAIYQRVPVLMRDAQVGGNPWGISFSQGLFNMATDSAFFRSREQLETAGWQLKGNVFVKDTERHLPLYEAKMFDFFDHRAADIVISAKALARQGQPARISVEEHRSPDRLAMPRYWVDEREVDKAVGVRQPRDWFIAFGRVTSATNARTVVPTALPYSAVGHNAPLIFVDKTYEPYAPCLLACLSSFALDYSARFKVGGTDLNFFIVEQLPVLPPSAFEALAPWDRDVTVANWLGPRLLELCYTAVDLAAFGATLGYSGPPFRWDPERRTLLEAEVQAAFFHLYGFTEQDVDHSLDSFPIVKRHDESNFGGVFRTKSMILRCYSEISHAVTSTSRFQSKMHPAPGDPAQAHSSPLEHKPVEA